MKNVTQLALMVVAAAGFAFVAYTHRRLGAELIARAEIEALEQIPVLED